MFRPGCTFQASRVRFPRTRGDVPGPTGICSTGSRFSPYTRGCSGLNPALKKRFEVFPVHAGMFRRSQCPRGSAVRFPRTRGDVPGWLVGSITPMGFSPYTRGCSGAAGPGVGAGVVFPVHAGMFHRARLSGRGEPRFPRTRGDVPPPAR